MKKEIFRRFRVDIELYQHGSWPISVQNLQMLYYNTFYKYVKSYIILIYISYTQAAIPNSILNLSSSAMVKAYNLVGRKLCEILCYNQHCTGGGVGGGGYKDANMCT
jgi:hypothetical protein